MVKIKRVLMYQNKASRSGSTSWVILGLVGLVIVAGVAFAGLRNNSDSNLEGKLLPSKKAKVKLMNGNATSSTSTYPFPPRGYGSSTTSTPPWAKKPIWAGNATTSTSTKPLPPKPGIKGNATSSTSTYPFPPRGNGSSTTSTPPWSNATTTTSTRR